MLIPSTMSSLTVHLLLLLPLLFGLNTAHAIEKPDILFISIDDLNDYISPLDNHPGIITPNFERLAKRSVTFANAHCASPACHPSRVAVMTGVAPATSGIYRNLFGAHGPRWRDESPVLKKAVVLSKHFSDHGYHAAGGGKIFHTLQWTPGDSQNDPEAWDEYRGDPLDPISADWPRPKLVSDADAGLGPGRPLSHQLFGAAPLTEPEESYGDQLVVDWAVEQLNAKRDKPLFLAVGLFRPHIPFEVPQKYFDLYPIDKVQLPKHLEHDLEDAHEHGRRSWHKWVTDNKQWPHFMQGYLASISYVDAQLGRLLDGLDASGRADRTVVVLWSDHGFHIGEKENWEKFALWDQTTRVPLFIHAPGRSKDGAKTRQTATLTDLYPTLCELAGLPIPEQCDGHSLVPNLIDPQAAHGRLSLTSFQFGSESAPSHAVSDPQFRFIEYANGQKELYDLLADPNEFTNLAERPEHAATVARLAEGIPRDAAAMVKIPTDSPYHRGRRAKNEAKSAGPIQNRTHRIRLRAVPKAGASDGVLLAHGGDHHGYSIYIKDQRPHFAVRRDKKLTTIAADEALPDDKPFQLEAILVEQGDMKIRLLTQHKGKEIATDIAFGNCRGLISRDPNEGRNIGQDLESSVGDYIGPFKYAGKVQLLKHESVAIK